MDSTQFRSKNAIRAYIAEFFGMMFFLFIGVGTACSSGYAVQSYAHEEPYVKFAPNMSMVLTVAFAFGLAIMVLVYGTAHISGGHLNPAVTMSMIIFREIDPIRGVLYIVSQVLGATFGVFLVSSLWPSEITATVGLGANAAIPAVSTLQAFFLEFFGTALLCFTVFNTAVDPQGAGFTKNMAPLAIGISVFLAHVVLVPMTGCGINPARTFGSALISGNWNHHWVYWVGPLIGGPCGAAINYIPHRYLYEPDVKTVEQTPLLG